MNLSQAQESFIVHWGEMGPRWGITRVAAQVHALLMVSDQAIDAQEISNLLSVARSNVSTSLKELQVWGLVKLVHVMGDRREHFEADKDPWQILAKIADRRLELEILPTIQILKQIRHEKSNSSKEMNRLLDGMVNLLEASMSFYKSVRAFSPILVMRLLKLEGKLQSFLRRGKDGNDSH